jgi:quaternary ammonium compound-resistance protein SugE
LRNLTGFSRDSVRQVIKRERLFIHFNCYHHCNPTKLHKPENLHKQVVWNKMEWVYLLIAGLFEAAWAIGLKYTEGFTRLYPSIFTVACMIISFDFLSRALKTLPIGTAYAVWTGIGIIGTTVLGILLFKESMDFGRIVCIFLIFSGVLGLKLISP